MLERFSAAARQAVADARTEAGRAGQDRVGTEHLLLGLISEPGTAADALTAAGLSPDQLRARLPRGANAADRDLDGGALASMGIDLDSVRRAAEATFGPGALDRARLPGRKRLTWSDEAKQSLAGAARHAQRLGRC
jgi:ATP-dependent Clp protease ATP-binding subunit ClpA